MFKWPIFLKKERKPQVWFILIIKILGTYIYIQYSSKAADNSRKNFTLNSNAMNAL